MNKRFVILIAILLVMSAASVYFSEASVYYSLQPLVVEKINTQWYSREGFDGTSFPGVFFRIYLANRAIFDGTFNIVIKLTNATFTDKPFKAAQLIDNHQMRIPYTLHAGEKTVTVVNFVIDNSTLTSNVRNPSIRFEISIGFESNQGIIRSTEDNWAGQNKFSYYQEENNTWMAAMIS